MPTTLIAFYILIILLPGFAAAYVVQMLAMRNAQTDFDKVIESCVYSFLIYSVFVLFTGGVLPFESKPVVTMTPPLASSAQTSSTVDTTIQWQSKQVLGLAAITFLFAMAGTAYINLDGNRVFRKLKITERTTRRSIWNDIFENEAKPTQAVQVELGDGRSILGVLSYYSDSADDCSLYIEQAFWVDSAGTTTQIVGPGILLTKNAAIKSISLLT